MAQQQKNILVVTIDTEEDNWGQHRTGITCNNINEIPRLQALFDSFGIVPTYLVTYQVCLQDQAVNVLREIQRTDRCEIGTHLHPWNTPPEIESLTSENSFLKNLDYELQLTKLKVLTKKIEEVFGLQPQSFRTGRWGLGKETIDALLECGYRVDTSVTPTLSWEKDGNGPVFKNIETDPYLLEGTKEDNGSIFEIPATIGYNRWPFSFWDKVYKFADNDAFKPIHLLGFLNKTSILRKLWFTPEGFSSNRLISLANILLRHNKRLLNLSFHSNTLFPGATPFVKTPDDVDNFFATLSDLFKYLLAETDFCPMTLSEGEDEYRGHQKDISVHCQCQLKATVL